MARHLSLKQRPVCNHNPVLNLKKIEQSYNDPTFSVWSNTLFILTGLLQASQNVDVCDVLQLVA